MFDFLFENRPLNKMYNLHGRRVLFLPGGRGGKRTSRGSGGMVPVEKFEI